MASNRKKTQSIRERKKRPNKSNRKADLKRIRKNSELLKELASSDEK